MTIEAQRREWISGTVDRIRAIERDRGLNRDALEEMKAALLQLAGQKALFPRAEFPPPEGTNILYRLSEDDDHRYALYLSSASPGKNAPPHNHATWAVIAGIEGEEENFQRDRISFDVGKGTCSYFPPNPNIR